MIEHLYMAGALQNLGNNVIGVLAGWAKPALEAIVGLVIVVKIIQRFSIKAGIGVALAAVVCLGIYNDRDNLGSVVTNELQSDTHGLAQLHHPLQVLPGTAAEVRR
ncbi:hypothetical protein [Streptacidiphilus neutrinimicus]|uniref:hypothetical protein n=1 Tax=Streptacidiphilus neutrinimicus TaxID=105420 RepID=UPI0005A9C2C7|nr:hypothetical protein [Streptacidiphilus neutrinimicus]